LDSGETTFLKDFMKLVFQKGATEEIFCPLYAKLLSELSSKYPVLLKEMSELYSSYIDIFEEISEIDGSAESSGSDDSEKNYSNFVENNLLKKQRQGYSQFLAELIKHSVVDIEIFMKTLMTIVEQIQQICDKNGHTGVIEEYSTCLFKIVIAINQSNVPDVVKFKGMIKDNLLTFLMKFKTKNPEYVSISNKGRFAFMDIYDIVEKF
jgi:hypothetical protein